VPYAGAVSISVTPASIAVCSAQILSASSTSPHPASRPSKAGDSWVELDLVFCTRQGSALDAANVRRSFRLIASAAGLNHTQWTPARATAQPCVLAVKLWGDHRGDRTLGRPWKYERHAARTGRNCAQSSHIGCAPSTSTSIATPSDRPRQFGRQVNRSRRQTGVHGPNG
jgi:hypothetical protein